MASKLIERHREGAEIYEGQDACKRKLDSMLEELGLPTGLLPLRELEEVGHNRSTGFVWLKQKQQIQHRFKRIGKTASFDREVTAFVEPGRLREITGAKVVKYFVGITVSDMYRSQPAVPDHPNSSDEITFAISAGISVSFPIEAFQEPQDQEDGDDIYIRRS
ncbi:hypothetical protein Dimus_030999 [Dionaea muscipula]